MISSLSGLVDLTILTQIVVLHLALDLVFRVTLGDKRGTSTNNKNDTGSRLCVLLAYNITAAAVATFCASVGCAAWFGGEAATIGGTVQSRLYGESASFARLGAVTAAYEAYNTLVVLVVPEYRTTAFVGHHAATFVLALLSQAPYLHYYGLFFFGVASVSSVPLAVVEVAKCAGLTRLHDRARGVFAAAFLALRSLYWPLVSLGFWADSVAALRGAVAVHSVAAVVTFLVANIGLTGLQLLWTKKVVKGVQKALGLRAPPARKEAASEEERRPLKAAG